MLSSESEAIMSFLKVKSLPNFRHFWFLKGTFRIIRS